VQTDYFLFAGSATVVNGGTGYAVGDIITLASGPSGSPPIGAPATLQVLTAPGGVIATVGIFNQVNGAVGLGTGVSGFYFAVQTNPIAQGSTTGVGTGATFNIVQGGANAARVILTNQEFATLSYVAQVTDPNVMDSLFQTAWINLVASAMMVALKENSRDKANSLIKLVNERIMEARVADGNEGLVINDVTPDFIRIRGNAFGNSYTTGPYDGFQWGDCFGMY
jgi:hypothetical protein